MNLALFMHQQKSNKNQNLPLPIAPVYILPHHRWYFSNHHLVLLRKRKENTSFQKYVKDIAITHNGMDQQHLDITDEIPNPKFICFYEKMTYFQTKLKHILDTLAYQLKIHRNFNQYYTCKSCKMPPKTINYGAFKSTLKQMTKAKTSCKNIKSKPSTPQDDNINWHEFTKKLLNDHLHVLTTNIAEEALYIYKLPQTNIRKEVLIFSLIWNNNYVMFNNESELLINKHMKSKAIGLCQSINMRVQENIREKVRLYCEENVEVMEDEGLRELMVEKLRVHSFKIWFYKNDENNQIYLLNLTNLAFRGTSCELYDQFFFAQDDNTHVQTPQTEQENDGFNIDSERHYKISPKNMYKQQLTKNKSYSSQVHDIPHKQPEKTIKSQLNKQNKAQITKNNTSFKLKNKKEDPIQNIVVNITKQTSFKHNVAPQKWKEEVSLSDIQCTACRNLLNMTEYPNQITAKHIEEIRYLRQIKIGKIQYDPYEFVKVCSSCYSIFMKHYKQNQNKLRNKSLTDKNLFNHMRIKDRDSFLDDKTEQISRITSNKRLYMKRIVSQTQSRSKSQLKDKYILNNRIKEKSVSMKNNNAVNMIIVNPHRHVKNRTTKTYNTDYSIHYRQGGELNKTKVQEDRMEKSANQYENKHGRKQIKANGLRFKSQSTKLKQNTQNLINKVLTINQDFASVQSKSVTKTEELLQHERARKKMKEEFLIHAISQYEQLQRPSFKKILYKKYKKGTIRDSIQLDEIKKRQAKVKQSKYFLF